MKALNHAPPIAGRSFTPIVASTAPNKNTAIKTNSCARTIFRYFLYGFAIITIIGIPFLVAYLCCTRLNTEDVQLPHNHTLLLNGFFENPIKGENIPPERRDRYVRTQRADIDKRLQTQLTRSQGHGEKGGMNSFTFIEALPPSQRDQDPLAFDASEYNSHYITDSYQAIGCCQCQGRRDTMEDEVLIESFPFREAIVPLFGIFDGHGGSEASKYIKDNIKNRLHEVLQATSGHFLDTTVAIWNALKIVFVVLSDEFNSQDAQHQAGSTAVIAIILDGRLWIANVGDSRAILVPPLGKKGYSLSEDAKPSIEYYAKGIRARGGQVDREGRVSGINIARAIGDSKSCGALSARSKVVALPLSDIPEGSHLILASDGLYAKATTQQVIEGVQNKVAADERNGQETSIRMLAESLARSAYTAGSRDNISVVAIRMCGERIRPKDLFKEPSSQRPKQ
jgi:protein phosphatase 1L